MSLQSDATKTPSDEWKVRAALKPKEHYGVEDFPIGRLIVGESYHGGKGRVGYALCRVIDCYGLKALRYHSDGLAIHGRVVASEDDFLAHLVGHVVQLGLSPRGAWYSGSGLRVTNIPPKQMFASAIEAQRAGTTEIGPVEDESAVANGETPTPSSAQPGDA